MNDTILAIRNIAEGKQPKIDISEILYNHGCLYLLSKLNKNSMTEKAVLECTSNHICAKTRFLICAPVFLSLKEADIPYAVIKGAILSQMAYNNPVYRSSADIDLLVSRSDIDKVKKIFFSNGFIQGRIVEDNIIPFTREDIIFQTGISHQTAPFIKQSNNPLCPFVNVDVNLSIMWSESKEKSDINYVLSETDNSELYGVQFRKLKPEMEFISLCLHHYKDMNSLYMLWSGKLRLSLFSDIFYYVKNMKPDTEKLQLITDTLKIRKYIYYCLYYTNMIFKSKEIKSYTDALISNDSDELMNTYGLDNNERKTWTISFFERLLYKDIKMYLDCNLNESDKKKIHLNSKYM